MPVSDYLAKRFQSNARFPDEIAILLPSWVDIIVLTADTPSVYTLPKDADDNVASYLLFNATNDFWVRQGDVSATLTAAPTATDITGANPELNPMVREVPSGVTQITLIAATATTVVISAYLQWDTRI